MPRLVFAAVHSHFDIISIYAIEGWDNSSGQVHFLHCIYTCSSSSRMLSDSILKELLQKS